MKRTDMPIIGYINVPIRAWSLNINKESWQSGGAFWWGADCTVGINEDSDNSEEYQGMMGGNMAGGYGYSISKGENRFYGEIYMQDLYDAILKQLDNVDESTIAKIKESMASLEEVNKMQKKAEEEAELERLIALEEEEKKKKLQEEEAKKKEEESLNSEHPAGSYIMKGAGYYSKDFLVLDDNGWDLTKRLHDYDYQWEEDPEYIFEPEWGTNVIVQQINRPEQRKYISDPARSNWNVNLKVTSYVGISPGAQHYYAQLEFGMPNWRKLEDKDNLNYSTSVFDLPGGYSDESINLSRPLTSKEIKEDPERYRGYEIGSMVNLWYSKEKIKARALEVFAKVFTDPRWKLNLDSLDDYFD